MDVVILAGGKGTRLRDVVPDRPKSMATVAGRPFLEWLFAAVHRQGLRRVTLCTGFRAEAIEEHCGDGSKWGLEIQYSRESEPLGTGGAVRNALNKIASDRILVMNGDSLCQFSVQRMIETHTMKRALATIWLVPHDECSRFGSVVLRDDGSVERFSEKGSIRTHGLISAGIYLFERNTLESIPLKGPYSLEHGLFPCLLNYGLYAVLGEEGFVDIGTPESYCNAPTIVTLLLDGSTTAT